MFRKITNPRGKNGRAQHRSATVPSSPPQAGVGSSVAAAASKAVNSVKRLGPALPGARTCKRAPRRADSVVFRPELCTLRPRYRALVFGLTYASTAGMDTLEGCHNDAHAFSRLLRRTYGWEGEDITVMTDEEHNWGTKRWPTKVNMEAAIRELVAGARAGDMFVIYYAGHSGQVPAVNDLNEVDGCDEYMISVDNEHILDDNLRMMLVNPLPNGTRLTAIFDSCHSGTLLDLKLSPTESRKSDGRIKATGPKRKPRAQSLPTPVRTPFHWGKTLSWMPLRAASRFYAAMRSARCKLSQEHTGIAGVPLVTIDAAPGGSQTVELDARTIAASDVSSILTNTGPDPVVPPMQYEETTVVPSAELFQPDTPPSPCPHCRALQLESPIVNSISACQDNQTAAEDSRKKTGVFTPRLIKVLKREPNLSFQEVKERMSPKIFEVFCRSKVQAVKKQRNLEVSKLATEPAKKLDTDAVEEPEELVKKRVRSWVADETETMPWQALQLGHEKAHHKKEPLLRVYPGKAR